MSSPAESSDSPSRQQTPGMARCTRCLGQKKGCSGGRPCERCQKAGIGAEGCIPKVESGRRVKKNPSVRAVGASSRCPPVQAVVGNSIIGEGRRQVEANRDRQSQSPALANMSEDPSGVRKNVRFVSGPQARQDNNQRFQRAADTSSSPEARSYFMNQQSVGKEGQALRQYSPTSSEDSEGPPKDYVNRQTYYLPQTTFAANKKLPGGPTQLSPGLEVDENGVAQVPAFLRRPSASNKQSGTMPPTKNFSTSASSRIPSANTVGKAQNSGIPGPRDSLDELLYRPRAGVTIANPSMAAPKRSRTGHSGPRHADPIVLVRHEDQVGEAFWRDPEWFDENEICRYCEQSLHRHADWCQEDPIMQPASMRSHRRSS